LTGTGDGTTTVTLSGSNTELEPGMQITINSQSKWILSVSGTTMVVNTAVAAGGPYAITYTTPVFKGFGEIEA
jgi:hypothetical protein